MKRHIRRGFTLVELLVVITIISMLMALLLPAVQSARESGRRATCMNNQKQLATALLNYESSVGQYPGYAEYLGPTAVPPATPAFDAAKNPQHDVSWIVTLFPYMEQNDLWNKWRKKVTTDEADLSNAGDRPAVFIRLLACPSDVSTQDFAGSTSTSYVVNCGQIDLPFSSTVTKPDAAANGVFFDHSSTVVAMELPPPTGRGITAARETMSLDMLTQLDGSANTLMVSENIQVANWVPLTSSTPGTRRTPIVEADCGFVWSLRNAVLEGEDPTGTVGDPTNPPTTYAINEDLGSTLSDIYHARPSSRHPGVVVATFCDGHTQVLRDNIDYKVYQHLMTPDGKKAGLTGVLDPGSM